MSVAEAAAEPRALPLRVLLLDDDPGTLKVLSRILGKEGHDALEARTLAEARAILASTVPDVAVVDVHLKDEDGLDCVQAIRRNFQDMAVVVISSEDTEELAKKALDSGADDFLSKPISPTALLLTVRKLQNLRNERTARIALQRRLAASSTERVFPNIVHNSDAMEAVLNLVRKVAARDLSVLVCGESGSGKELVAQAIHQQSPRADGPFIELNCAALPANLVESELFGHEKGAFTGALNARAGKIEQADGGTLFLDEIGELPLEIQPKLLRALQEKHVTRVGGKATIRCDFRLITATNRDLVEEVREGRFREDLFYRVAVFPIQLPPLRDRMEDLGPILQHFLRQEQAGELYLSSAARRMLHAYRWPGNIRELKNFSQAIPLLVEGDMIDEPSVRRYFGSRLDSGGFGPPEPAAGAGPHLAPGDPNRPVRRLADIEREEVLHALATYKGNVSEAARALDMGRATLYKYLKRHGIELEQF